MRVKIEPSFASGKISAPPSKSIAHRLILCAALANGVSKIGNIALSEDVLATVDCVHALGAKTEHENGTLTVVGIDASKLRIGSQMPCRECGSTMRFFLPLAMLTSETTVFTGSKTLLSRPMQIYERICKDQGIDYEKNEAGIRVGGILRPGVFRIPGNVSSQFVSGLLFALPLLDGNSEIVLTGTIESRPYIELTLAALRSFGVNAVWENENTLTVNGRQKYTPAEIVNEGDWSNAAFLLALAKDHPVQVHGLNDGSLQGDMVCSSYFERLQKEACTLDISNCPDLGPILFAFAAMHHGGSFTGTSRLAVKESDRGAAMAAELKKFGVQVVRNENEIIIPKTALHAPDAVLNGHNDHRIVMSLAVMCVKYGGVIEGAQAVNKSYPSFFEDLKKLKVNLTYEA